ncbi:hypothetical protein BP5796_04470 [Coleophoma crateriformis]|uniref:Uncharacterized protein n=1 Tax=Coleophoma crateriformis TaxID=565419 RepID=A0A3D8S9E9_9HELO|nr:hypothetical protein BP5796_04470 [Coleophoma crateriformis]
MASEVSGSGVPITIASGRFEHASRDFIGISDSAVEFLHFQSLQVGLSAVSVAGAGTLECWDAHRASRRDFRAPRRPPPPFPITAAHRRSVRHQLRKAAALGKISSAQLPPFSSDSRRLLEEATTKTPAKSQARPGASTGMIRSPSPRVRVDREVK